MRAQRVMAYELRLNVQPRQAELVDRQQSDLLFGQLVEQGHRFKGVTRLLEILVEQDAVFGRQVEDAHQFIEHLVGVPGALAGHGQVEAGPVIGQQHTVAIVDHAALRRDRQHMHTVVFGNGRVIVELDDLEKIHARHQAGAEDHHDQGASDQPPIDQTGLFLVVL